MHNRVKWLGNSLVLHRCVESLPEIKDFYVNQEAELSASAAQEMVDSFYALCLFRCPLLSPSQSFSFEK